MEIFIMLPEWLLYVFATLGVIQVCTSISDLIIKYMELQLNNDKKMKS